MTSPPTSPPTPRSSATSPPASWAAQQLRLFHHSILRSSWIPQRPTPRQAAFLLAAHREVLYGGSAGGGKSIALLMAAAQYVDVPGYAALLLRQSFPDLMQPGALIPVSKEWWSNTTAEWNSQQRRWLFPSGATITFGYLETDDDVYQYQGAAYQFIGLDELTQHSEFRYRYLFSRLRRLTGSPVPLRMRASSNPGGRGHEWVKKRFLDSQAPDRLFVPARLADNPYLDHDEYVASLAHLDPLTRAQLLAGDWDATAQGRFRREWLRYWHRHGSGYNLAGSIVPQERLIDRFLTVDTASTVQETAKDDPDWTVISAWGVTPCVNLLWLGCLRLRVEVPDIPPRVAEQYTRHRARRVVIEGGGTQKGVCQLVRRQPLGSHSQRMNVVEVIPGTDKLDRAAALLNAAEAGRVWLPAQDPAFPVEDVEAELLRFTGDPKRDAHDDIVDTASMAGMVLSGAADTRDNSFAPYILGG